MLGPNGAGKTTAVRILATLTVPDAGDARVAGHDVVREAGAVRASIGLAGQYAAVDEDLTGRENLEHLRPDLAPRPPRAPGRADELLDASSSPTPPTGWSRPGRAACGGGST